MELPWTLNDKSQSYGLSTTEDPVLSASSLTKRLPPLYASAGLRAAGAFDKRDAHTPGRVKGSGEFVVPCYTYLRFKCNAPSVHNTVHVLIMHSLIMHNSNNA